MQNRTEDRKFLVFEVHGMRYALDLAQIAEVADPLPGWPVPLAPSCCTGAVQIHGAIVAVIDLAAFLGFEQCASPEKMIVLSKDLAAMAFLVARVIRIVSEQEVQAHDTAENDLACSRLTLPDGGILLLDVNKIILAAEDIMK